MVDEGGRAIGKVAHLLCLLEWQSPEDLELGGPQKFVLERYPVLKKRKTPAGHTQFAVRIQEREAGRNKPSNLEAFSVEGIHSVIYPMHLATHLRKGRCTTNMMTGIPCVDSGATGIGGGSLRRSNGTPRNSWCPNRLSLREQEPPGVSGVVRGIAMYDWEGGWG